MENEIVQTTNHKVNEIEFRRKLANQGITDSHLIIPESLNKKETLDILTDRISKTRKDIKQLINSGIIVNPYLEIGAERVQRALMLENEFGYHGFAIDISLESLKYAEIVADHFNYNIMPIRIACDAYNLPFQDSSIPFAFSYQTLHHFPNPKPICHEVSRVLINNGHFFINEEPVKGSLTDYTRIYKIQGHRYPPIAKLLGKLNLLGLVTDFGNLERTHGILEEEFKLDTWVKAFSDFYIKTLMVRRFEIDPLFHNYKHTLIQLVGGFMETLLKVKKPASVDFSKDAYLINFLRCPNCNSTQKLQLQNTQSGLTCSMCDRFYPKVDGIYMLFEESLGKKLYPNYLP